VLGREIASKEEARRLAENLMLLIADHLAFQDAEFQRDKLFLSYARTDRDWLAAVKTQLRALPEQSIEVWDDTVISAGASFEREIQRAMAASRACLLLVTPEFLSSRFIREHELPCRGSDLQRELFECWHTVRQWRKTPPGSIDRA